MNSILISWNSGFIPFTEFFPAGFIPQVVFALKKRLQLTLCCQNLQTTI